MSNALPPQVPGSPRADLLGIVIAVAVGVALAVVGIIGTTSAIAGDGPGKPTSALVSYDQ
ncbi:MAG TPA: hypothetical protein VI248_16130 [Kineosporiaceae bacterium]